MGLAGKRVLVVEDEPILAMSIEDMLSDFGCIAVGPALSVSDALAMAREEEIDAALLDINMGNGLSFQIADVLLERGVPFCFATGYGAAGVPAALCFVPVLPKPFTTHSLKAVLSELLEKWVEPKGKVPE